MNMNELTLPPARIVETKVTRRVDKVLIKAKELPNKAKDLLKRWLGKVDDKPDIVIKEIADTHKADSIEKKAEVTEDLPLKLKAESDKNVEIDLNRDIFLPSTTDLPESYQQKSQQNLELMKVSQQKFIGLESKIDKFSQVVDGVVKDFEPIVNEQANKELSDKMAKELKIKLKTEIDILSQVRSLLFQGKDVTQILGSGESYRYGKVRGLRQFVDQQIWKREEGYLKGKQEFDDRQWATFNSRVSSLNEMIEEFVGATLETVSIPSASGWDLEAADFNEKTDTLKESCKTAANGYREGHRDRANKKAALQNVKVWLEEDWSKEINLTSLRNPNPVSLHHVAETIEVEIGKMNAVDQQVMNKVGDYKSQPRSYRSTILIHAQDLSERIYQSINDPGLQATLRDVNNRDYDNMGYCGTSREEYEAIVELSKWLNTYVDTNKFNTMKNSLEALSRANKKFAGSQDVMLHGGQTDVLISKVILPGLLLSRAEQMKMFGEANFASAGMIARKRENGQFDLEVKLAPAVRREQNNITADQLNNEKGKGGKSWLDEYNEICFSENNPYKGADPEILLCFGKASILSNRQFMVADGWHVFDGGYKGIPDSDGFKVNLNEEPHLMLLVNASYLPAFREKLLTASPNGKLLGGSVEIEEWIEKNVMIVESMNSKETQQQIRNEFYKRFPPKKQQGFFMPTGYSLQGLGAKELVTYKTKN